MSDTQQIEAPLPAAIVVQKPDVSVKIDWRKKKSGKAGSELPAGTPIPFLEKGSLSLDGMVKAFSEEFVLRCAYTRLNTALQDWYKDTIKTEGLFIQEAFVKRVMLGKIVRQSAEEIREALFEVSRRVDALVEEIDANGGVSTPEGYAANSVRIAELVELNKESVRLNALKEANKRKKSDDDDSDE